MLSTFWSAIWGAVPPSLGNHLWQTTLCVIVAGLLTLALRKNHAGARYWLWLAASAKFLIPFSLLMGIGGHFAWSHASPGTTAGLYFAMDEISQPFAQPAVPVISQPAPSTLLMSSIHLLPTVLATVWFIGFLAVLFVWCTRWRRISAAMRAAVPLREGCEVEALRRMERIAGIRTRIEMRLSRGSLEPGIFGIARPILIWPEGISERLDDAHLEAILAHEVWHVRRRDNLAAAVHMVVEAIFWFYPVVWWLGGRLVEERERACDEEVVRLGNQPQVYAESILKTCEFCVESPLACVSGITGSDLKNRIVRIMTERVGRKLDFRRKLLLFAAGLASVAVPIVFGQVKAMQSQAAGGKISFDVASVRLHQGGLRSTGISTSGLRLDAEGVNIISLINYAYDLKYGQLGQTPALFVFMNNWYDVHAEAPGDGTPTKDEFRRMMQSLLADRFKLTIHHEMRETPVYDLVVDKNGPKFKESAPNTTFSSFVGVDGTNQTLTLTKATMEQITDGIQNYASRIPVVDKTGLTGTYDIKLEATMRDPDESGAISIFDAVQGQLGLKLVPQKAMFDVIVVDHVEKPSAN